MQVEIYKTLGGKNDLFTATVNGYSVIDNDSKLPAVVYRKTLQEIYSYLCNADEINVSSRRLDGYDEYAKYTNLVQYEFADSIETKH